MKKLAKVLSLALVLVMVLSLGGTAWAEDPTTVTTGSISISNEKPGHTYEAYQIFDGDLINDGGSFVLSNIAWGSGVTNTTSFSWSPVTGTTLTTAKAVADYLAGLSGEAASAAADALATYLKNGSFLNTHKDATAPTGGLYTINELDAGYYLVVDKPETLSADADDVYSDYIVQVLGTVTNIAPKGSIPSLDKQVADNETGTADDTTSNVATNPTNKKPGDGWFESADHKINERFQFKLLATIPASVDLADYPTYEIVFNDVMSTGVTFESIASVKIKNAGDASFSDVPAAKYTPSTNIYDSGAYKTLDGDGNTAWTLTITDVKTAVNNLNFTKDIMIEVIYNAHLNANAPVLKVTGNDASKNTSYITYSNNPNANTKGKSSEDHVWVFTYEVDNIKVDGANKTDVTTTADATLKAAIDGVATGSAYTHTDGKVYIKEGDNYYELPPFAGVGFTLKNSDGTTVNLIWDNTKEAYRPATAEEATASDYSAEITSRATTGKFNIIGLDAGTYTLEETTVPSGYNKAQNITVTIGATHQENDDQITATATLTNTNTNNAIVNNKGNQLPSTGGIGTTLFYVFGSMLVIAAGVYFVTKKRSEVE